MKQIRKWELHAGNNSFDVISTERETNKWRNLKYLTIMMQFEISPLCQPSVDDDSGRDDIIPEYY